MCADSIPADGEAGSSGSIVLQGRVEKRPLGQGTKSAHPGMVLVLPDGRWHVLRRAGGHAYSDPMFEAMEGQQVRLRGRLRPNFFLVDGLDEEPND
ncbi:hypothetical protein AACH06_11725 [Ideonella sp. DXS29W]|uniref:Uncharacterized protein n=1 Tax=Ideonella lacteola TaxID=2984193 RepID=A0ABU9BPV1_9BURK